MDYCDNTKVAMLKQIQALEFVAVELNLFLDTHPTEQRAINDYNVVVHRLETLKKQYEQSYGPLTNFGTSHSGAPWQWIEEPWPWDIEY